METRSSQAKHGKDREDEDLDFPLPWWFIISTLVRFFLRVPFFLLKILANSVKSGFSFVWQKFFPKEHKETARKRTLCIGHRGARTEKILENSFQAFSYAREAGVDGIELDARISRDGVPVVLHDSTLDRTSQSQGKVEDLDSSFLRKIRLKNGEPLPFLEDTIRKWGGKILLNIEIKKERTAEQSWVSAFRICKILEESRIPRQQVVISSFSPLVLYYVRKFPVPYPRYQLIADSRKSFVSGLSAWLPGTWVFALGWDACGMVWEKSILFRRPFLYALAHFLGLEVWIYTSNHPEEWKQAWEWGVDGIITDFPKECVEFLKNID